jgi:hypothetical protein
MKKRKSRLATPPKWWRRRLAADVLHVVAKTDFAETQTREKQVLLAAFFVAFVAAVAATDMTKAKHYRPPVKTSLPLLYLSVFFLGFGLVFLGLILSCLSKFWLLLLEDEMVMWTWCYCV